jgi:transposase
LRDTGLDVECLDARPVKAALQMRLNKTDENDAEGLAQVMRTGWYRPVHVKSLDAHRARALLGARAQLVGMTTPAFQFDTRRAERLACSLAPAGVSDSIAGSRR